MPHAEKTFSHHVHDSSIEPCLKRSRPDYSSSWARRDPALSQEHEAKPQKWTFSSVLAESSHPSNRGDGEGGGVNVKSDPASHGWGHRDANEKDCKKTKQRSFVLPGSENPEDNADVAFSGTSTSFIGPLYRPATQPVAEVTRPPHAKSPPFKIATVELGKLANQSKGRDGMDYELRQFYKELNELEAEASDQTKAATCSNVDVKDHISPYPDNTPTTLPSDQHHGQVPTSQPLAPFPSPPLPCLAREEPRPQLERPSLPLNNLFSFDGQAPYHPISFSFASHATPPPGFEDRPPPTFIVPYDPPPTRFNYPMTFPRQNDSPPPEESPSINYDARNDSPPWYDSLVPSQSRFTPQAIPYGEPLSLGTGERTWPDLPRDDLGIPADGQFSEWTLPPGSDVSHEQYLGRFGDESKKMVLLRGVPGSGKSTLARTLLRLSPDGVVLSTDDYFCQENGYTYDVKLLGDAHTWNQDRARRALDDGRSPVIIDNTNSQAWEMKPYVQMAVERHYDVEFLEPDTWWKQDPHELEKRNTHRVPRETISKMLERYQYDMTVPAVMNSVEPRRNRPPPEAHPRWGVSVDCSLNSSSFHSS